jgi:hypothetical protein
VAPSHVVVVASRHGGIVAPLWYCVHRVVLSGCGCCMAMSSCRCRLWSVIIGRGRGWLSLGRGDMAVAIVCLVVKGVAERGSRT